MGIRTYVHNITKGGEDREYPLWKTSSTCLGKLVAYCSDPKNDMYHLKQWCDKFVTDTEDKEYLDGQFWELGYCGEYRSFNQKFTREQAALFILAFMNDRKAEWGGWSLTEVLMPIILADKDDEFEIEWCGA